MAEICTKAGLPTAIKRQRRRSIRFSAKLCCCRSLNRDVVSEVCLKSLSEEQTLSVKSLSDKGASHKAFGRSVESEERSVIHGVSHRNTNMRHIFHVWTDNVLLLNVS